MIAIGVGCRKNCTGAEIAALVSQALQNIDIKGQSYLFTVIDKQNESGLHEAARMLNLSLTFLPREALAARMDQVQTKSLKAERLYGLASISEAAALAGAGNCAKLILPRIVSAGATCAIAVSENP
jgi:cobalt-precorrin 5A hydrolase